MSGLLDDMDEELGLDARLEIVTDHVEHICAAELAAHLAENEGCMKFMRCDSLDEVPDDIEDRWSSVLGDPFHAMTRPKTRVKHEVNKPYFFALMNAFFAWDRKRMKEVKETLITNGWTDSDIETMIYYKPEFFRKRVERIILPPRQLYWRVRAVYVRFGNKLDGKTGYPLFNKAAWAKANNILKEILLGFYSDPPGFDFYHFDIDNEGNPKTDKRGLSLLRCSRGTNDVENAHKHYATMFRHITGIELGDSILAERRHRHNQGMAERRVRGFPRLGHYDTWKIDRLQLLVERNHCVLLFPDWVNGSDYRDTDESFITVAIHSEELDVALKAQALEIDNATKKAFTSDQKFLCRAMGIAIPFLPVHGPSEFKLFTNLMLNKMSKFDADPMALMWISYVNGKNIFPKLPGQLREYHKRWERNRRIQTAVEMMKSDIAALDQLNLELIPTDLATAAAPSGSGDGAGAAAPTDENDFINDESSFEAGRMLQWPNAILPPSFNQPINLEAMYPSSVLGCRFVGLEMIGLGPSPLPSIKRAVGVRGPDKRKRTSRRCPRCIKFKGLFPEMCPGRGGKTGSKNCRYFDATGKIQLS
jgi:hypothetical protein